QLGVEDFESKPTSGNGLLLSFEALIILGALAYAAYQYFTPTVSESGGRPLAEVTTPTPLPASSETPTSSVSPEASISPSTSPTASPAASPTGSPSPTTSPSPSPTPQSPPAGVMRVQLTAPDEEVWLSVRPDGQKAQQMILKPGETREFDVNEKII